MKYPLAILLQVKYVVFDLFSHTSSRFVRRISKMESTSQLSTNLNTISFGKRKIIHVNSVTFQFQGKCGFFLQGP